MTKIEEIAKWIKTHESEITKEWKCLRCGACCLRWFELSADNDDLERWEGEMVTWKGNPYFLKYFAYVFPSGGADLWFNPDTDDELTRCPFLRKKRCQNIYECLINDPKLKPNICKDYPGAENLECPGIQQTIKQKFDLNFESIEEENAFLDKLDIELNGLDGYRRLFRICHIL